MNLILEVSMIRGRKGLGTLFHDSLRINHERDVQCVFKIDKNTQKVSREGRATKKTTVLSDRALGILRDAKRKLFQRMQRDPTVGRSVKMPRHKQPFWVRLYVSLVRVEFDACRVHNCVFDLGGLWTLFRVLVDKKLSDQKRLIKEYSQLRLNLYLDESFESSPELRVVEKRFRAAAGINYGRVVKRKSRKFRLLALELFQFKKITIQTTKDENSTREESIMKHRSIVGGDPVNVEDEEKRRFRRIVRDLLVSNEFSFIYSDCISSLPGGSSSVEVKGKDGGLEMDVVSRMFDLNSAPAIIEGTRCEFAGLVSNLYRSSSDRRARVVSCSDTFKDRILTIHPSHQFCLKPLQERLLSFLKKLDCFFIGKDSTDDFVRGLNSSGGLWCSGDYCQATDTFSSELTEVILEEIVDMIEFNLPFEEAELIKFKEYIVHSCTRWDLDYGDEIVTQRRGQLMGTLLSFPVLNIYNYAAFASLYEECFGVIITFKDIVDYVRINGDDILFNETIKFIDFWRDGLGRYGMTLNRAKTSVSGDYCSLNSQYYSFSVAGLVRMKSEMVYILNKERGYERSEKTIKKNCKKEQAQALFNARCWKSLNYLFKLHDLGRMELRKFFGPLTEEDADREANAIRKIMEWKGVALTGKELYLEPVDSMPCKYYHTNDCSCFNSEIVQEYLRKVGIERTIEEIEQSWFESV